MNDADSRYRRGYVIALGCLLVLWGLASWVVWSDLGLKLRAVPLMNIFLLPVGLLSWPAKEVCLEVVGLGFGYNARVPATFWTLMIFFIQAVVIWLPMTIPCVRRFRMRPWLVVQGLVFLVVFVSFWPYGNG